jgi:hypothetical protein
MVRAITLSTTGVSLYTPIRKSLRIQPVSCCHSPPKITNQPNALDEPVAKPSTASPCWVYSVTARKPLSLAIVPA